jgi:TldD protein
MKRNNRSLAVAALNWVAALKWVAAAGVLAATVAVFAQAPAPATDPLIQAMQDELERAKKLTLNGLEPPYFVEYTVDEAESFTLSASLGGLVSRRRDRLREPDVHVRVGDYGFDNTNFAGGGFFGSRYDLGRFPLENSYPLLRRHFWLLTDAAYKAAVEALSRKRAAVRNLQSEQLHDFARVEPVRHIRPFLPLAIDEETWTRKVRSLSAIFSQFPAIKDSSVTLDSSSGGLTLANTEGTVTREPEVVTYLRARASAQAPDGMTVRDMASFHALDPVRMPADAELTRAITALAQNVVALAHAPKGEDYSGPVLFEGIAGAQIMGEVLGKSLALSRRPVMEGRGGGLPPSDLEGRAGARVLPEAFDVVDDPTQTEWRGRPLFGSYQVDREGVTARPLRLIEKGVLKGYLMTRTPMRGFEGSNGHARLPGSGGASNAAISNLFVSTTDAMPPADLKKKLLEMCQQRGKPYGIIVRKMDFPSSASLDEARRLFAGQQGGHPVSMPVLVYKVFPDGREELVRGLRFRGLSARSLKDIVAAGTDSSTFEYMDNAAPFSLIGGAAFASEACVVAPSILIDDLELHPAEEEQPKLPVVSAPELTR